MKTFTLISCFFLLIHSCKKDKALTTIESGTSCIEVPDSLSPYQPGPPSSFFQETSYQYPQTNFRFPCFEPVQGKEFVYVKEVTDYTSIASNATIDELWVYNLGTKTSRIILKGVTIDLAPLWGYDGWIYFLHGALLKRCNATTLQVQQLSTSNYSFYLGSALSSPDGQFYAIRNVVFDQHNQPVDTLPNSCHTLGTWSVDGHIYGAGGVPKVFKNISISNGTVTTTPIPEFDVYTHNWSIDPWDGNQDIYVKGCRQIPNTDQFIISLTRHGNIWLYDESDSTCVIFKQGAYDSFFNGLSVRNDGQQILASFHREVPMNPSRLTFYIYEKIYLMDINGCNMEEVKLE